MPFVNLILCFILNKKDEKKVKKSFSLSFYNFFRSDGLHRACKRGDLHTFLWTIFAFFLLHIKEALCGRGRNEEVKSCKKSQKENEKNFCETVDRSVCTYIILHKGTFFGRDLRFYVLGQFLEGLLHILIARLFHIRTSKNAPNWKLIPQKLTIL